MPYPDFAKTYLLRESDTDTPSVIYRRYEALGGNSNFIRGLKWLRVHAPHYQVPVGSSDGNDAPDAVSNDGDGDGDGDGGNGGGGGDGFNAGGGDNDDGGGGDGGGDGDGDCDMGGNEGDEGGVGGGGGGMGGNVGNNNMGGFDTGYTGMGGGNAGMGGGFVGADMGGGFSNASMFQTVSSFLGATNAAGPNAADPQGGPGDSFSVGSLTSYFANCDPNRNVNPPAGPSAAAPVESEDDFRRAMRRLRDDEAARRFEAGTHMPSGPGQSSSPIHPLPPLPDTVPYLVGGMPHFYTVREVPIDNVYTLPGFADSDVINVRVGDVRQLYITALSYWGFMCFAAPCPHNLDKAYRRTLRGNPNYVDRPTGSSAGSNGSELGASVHENISRGPLPDFRRPRRSSRSDDVNSAAKRGR